MVKENKDKQIMFIIGALTGGGAEKVISILANGCADISENITLVSIWEKEISYKISDKVNFIQIKSTKSKFEIFRRINILRKIIKENNPDVLVPFLPIISLYTLFASFGLKKKIIMSERADPAINIFKKTKNKKDILAHFLFRKLQLFALADYMVFQTPDAQAYYCKNIQEKSCVIANPLDTSSLPERFEGNREKKIVAVGRLSLEKNFSLLIKTFSNFHKEHKEYMLDIYGQGNLMDDLQEIINENNLQEFICLKGFQKNVSAKIQNTSMYISTSNNEGISNSMLEALGMGIPTIVTDCPVGGARMFVKTNENGILIPMNDSDALLSAMNKIADDSQYAEKISKNAVKIREEISKESICRKWLDVIESTVVR